MPCSSVPVIVISRSGITHLMNLEMRIFNVPIKKCKDSVVQLGVCHCSCSAAIWTATHCTRQEQMKLKKTTNQQSSLRMHLSRILGQGMILVEVAVMTATGCWSCCCLSLLLAVLLPLSQQQNPRVYHLPTQLPK
jgi:hypothetical protein